MPLTVSDAQEQALRQAAEVERDRLFELTEMLKDRLAHANARAAEAQAQTSATRRGGTGGGGPGDEPAHALAMSTSISRSPVNAARHIQSLETRLAIQQDENRALKETLEEAVRVSSSLQQDEEGEGCMCVCM